MRQRPTKGSSFLTSGPGWAAAVAGTRANRQAARVAEARWRIMAPSLSDSATRAPAAVERPRHRLAAAVPPLPRDRIVRSATHLSGLPRRPCTSLYVATRADAVGALAP